MAALIREDVVIQSSIQKDDSMIDMLVKLYDLPSLACTLTALKEQGFLIRPAMPFERSQVVEWVRHSFGDGWAGECDFAFNGHPVSCQIAVSKETVIGFACFESTARDFFGPIGVKKEYRKLGIGRGLLISCLHMMASMGYAYAIIGGVGPTEFFAKVVGATEIEGSSPGIYRSRLKGVEQ